MLSMVRIAVPKRWAELVSRSPSNSAGRLARWTATKTTLSPWADRRALSVQAHLPMPLVCNTLPKEPGLGPGLFDEGHRMPFAAIAADGITPYTGIVLFKTAIGAFIDIGCEKNGLLHRTHFANSEVRRGDHVQVYVDCKHLDTNKLDLTLTPRDSPRMQVDRIIADGLTPYAGIVAHVLPFGTFVDFGCENQGFIPAKRADEEAPMGLQSGDSVVVYVTDKRRAKGKVILSLRPGQTLKKQWDNLVVDGQTPYEGVVEGITPAIGAFVDIGTETLVLLPARYIPSTQNMQVGDRVTVYLTCRKRHSAKITCKLEREAVPIRPVTELVADGCTPYKGVVVGTSTFATFVDFGFEVKGALHAQHGHDVLSFHEGQELVVYATEKATESGKVNLSLKPDTARRKSMGEIPCDGRTPIRGEVKRVSWYGAFVDIGADGLGRLPPYDGDERPRQLQVGDVVEVYAMERWKASGKLVLSLDPSPQPLHKLEDLVIDGHTPYPGTIRATTALGLWVDACCETRVLLRYDENWPLNDKSELHALSPGDVVSLYIYRRNMRKGTVTASLVQAPEPRKPLQTVLAELKHGSIRVRGHVYCVKFEEVYVDVGTEVGGRLPRSVAPKEVRIGDALEVEIAKFDEETARFLLAISSAWRPGRTRPKPPAKG